jgi:L-ascorbate metabolism protein UlaG (beta-lactamase superfamily)
MVSIAWLGQMGLKISVNATTVFVDYFASDYPGRRTPVPVAVEAVRGVDAFLGTHDHLDHIDHDAWRVWASACPEAKFVFPSVHRQSVLDDGVPEVRQLGIDAGQSVRVGEVTIHALPAAHEFLSPDDRGRYPALQYVIEGGGRRIYHAGDTLRYEGMRPLLEAFGHIDAALLPINGRDGARYRRDCIGNMTFQEAADLAGELRVGLALPGHWDMFADNPGDPAAFADYLDAKYGGAVPCVIPKMMEAIRL